MDILENIIKNENIKIISFDIFDTLLERPAINPTDIFSLLNSKIKKIKNKNFYDIRKNIENEAIKKLNNNNLNIYEIYDFLAKKYKLSNQVKEYLLNLEIELESNLLKARKNVKEIYNLAVQYNKKIICISDMYLTSDILNNILIKNGYTKIDKIYVSSEIKKRKDDNGLIYDYVISNEKITFQELLHIGDNKISDFEIPFKKGILSYYIPSSYKDFCTYRYTSKYSTIYNDNILYTESERVLIGFLINKLMENKNLIKENQIFSTLESIGYHLLGPMLLYISLYIMNNKEIQNNYPTIHFASRDGYLPMKAYDILTKDKTYLKSKYIYAGRRLYNIYEYDNNILKYLTSESPSSKFDDYTIKELLISKVGVEFYEILKKDNVNLNIKYSEDYKNNYAKLQEISDKYHDIINNILNIKKENLKEYYDANIELKNDRAVIFDVGYSGSVSKSISKIINKKIDKIYMWQFQSNKIADRKYKTKTYLLNSYIDFLGSRYNIFFEELFSSLENSAIEINKTDLSVVFDKNEIISDVMKKDMTDMQSAALSFINDFNDLFSNYIDDFVFQTDNLFIKNLNYLEDSVTDISLLQLKNIMFKDIYHYSNDLFLSEKLLLAKHPFYKTKFVDKSLLYNNDVKTIKTDKKIAIHIHLYHLDLIYEIAQYLKNVEIKFDLLISVKNEQDIYISDMVLNNKIIKNLNNVIYKVSENRGRDVAPWLILFKDEQEKYDYCCHIHTKKSFYVPWVVEWRNYLYDNLISKEAFNNIINMFENNINLGLIFPPPFNNLYRLEVIANINFYKDDEENIKKLLAKLNIPQNHLKDRLFFSMGTMFWYRPKALKKLFDINFTFEDFEKEPIDVYGTLAHTIERIPNLIVENEGYTVNTYINNKYLINNFYKNNYIELLEKSEYKSKSEYKEELKLKIGWFSIFNIYSNSSKLIIVIFGIRITIKLDEKKLKFLSKILPKKIYKEKFSNDIGN